MLGYPRTIEKIGNAGTVVHLKDFNNLTLLLALSLLLFHPLPLILDIILIRMIILPFFDQALLVW